MKHERYRLNDGTGFRLVASGLLEKKLLKKVHSALKAAAKSKLEFHRCHLECPERGSWILEVAEKEHNMRWID